MGNSTQWYNLPSLLHYYTLTGHSRDIENIQNLLHLCRCIYNPAMQHLTI